MSERIEVVAGEPWPLRRRVLVILAAAFAVRALYALFAYGVSGAEGLLTPDSTSFLIGARSFVDRLADGTLAGWDVLGLELDRMPIPGWLMALAYGLFGDGPLGFVLLQGVFDAVTCLMIAVIAGQLRSTLFWPAAIIAILNPTMVVVSGLYLMDTVFLFFCTLMFLGVSRWVGRASWGNVLIIGLALGCATLSRTLSFAFIPVMGLALVVAGLFLRRSVLRSMAQAVVVAALSLALVSPVLIRNHVRYDSLALTPQSGVHMLLWQVSLVREAVDGTPFTESARELHDRFTAENPDLDFANKFAVSNRMMAMALEELGKLGAGAIAKAWTTGAAINLGSPAATIAPPVAALPRTGFYDTPGDGPLAKIYAFLFENENTLYAWILGIGILGVILARLIQLRGLWVWLRTPGGARLYLSFAALWTIFILAVNGPVASPKYRLPFEPFLVIALAFGVSRRGVQTAP